MVCLTYNIAHVKVVVIFLLKNNNYLLKNYTFNIKCTSFNTNYFKLLNMYKFTYDRKTIREKDS
jgi:hypothetical protein